MRSRHEPSGLSKEALEKLLAYLDADPRAASEKYHRLHQNLTRFFEFKSCSSPEDLADEAFNRLARRLAAGSKIRTDEPIRFLRGVASNLAKEDYKRAARERKALEGYSYLESLQLSPEEGDQRRSCLDECLKRLASSERKLILTFYRGEKSERIKRRKSQAEDLGISRTALRIRAHRLRKELERCVLKCLGS